MQPSSEEELIRLVRWARENYVPLVARGKATSGYGGVLPVKGGIVVDLYHMRNVLDVDAQAETVTVQPGISWEQLDQQLLKQRLTLRLYPTSYPSSTVEGWLAQGGAGIGSYQFGYFRDSVLKARVILPDGGVREFAGDDLDLISDAEGVTGTITEVQLRIQQDKALRIRAFGTASASTLQMFISELHSAGLPLWSIQYINPHMARAKNESPNMEHFGEPAEREVTLPEQYIILIGRASGVYDAPHTFIRAIPNTDLVEMEHNREQAHCCGSIMSLIAEPPAAKEIGKSRIDEAIEAGATKIVTLCPCCQVQFRVTADKTQQPIEVQDLVHFGAERLGYELPDPKPEVRKQWAVFEKMIALMTPEGFAEIMREMLPQMLDAMPMRMGEMMRAFGRVPGALTLIKPTFPILFPRRLPRMMPKLMPTLIERVQQRLDMPEYMVEQMPDLMPKVMDQLMPHMVGDLVPLVSQDLVDHLHGATRTGPPN